MVENIKYVNSKVNKTIINRRIFYCLSFTFIFPSKETLKFAYSLPYTYSHLCKYLAKFDSNPYIKQETLCKSLSGVDIPMLTITDESPIEEKECILVTARVHPGETHGS